MFGTLRQTYVEKFSAAHPRFARPFLASRGPLLSAVSKDKNVANAPFDELNHLFALAVRSLISPHENHLLAVVVAEKLDELNRIDVVAPRLGRRCSLPALQGFEHVYSDLLAGRIDPSALGFLSRGMDGTVCKMERFASSTVALYSEIELSAKKFPPMPAAGDKRSGKIQKSYSMLEPGVNLHGMSQLEWSGFMERHR